MNQQLNETNTVNTSTESSERTVAIVTSEARLTLGVKRVRTHVRGGAGPDRPGGTAGSSGNF